MTKSKAKKEYFDWMYHLVYDKDYTNRLSYRKLLSCLHDTEFTFIIPRDSNRADDGEYLRYRFVYEHNYDLEILNYLNDRPCSVLEMIVALALRCEEDIMGDPEIGDRTGLWFWGMIDSLGLMDMDDPNFDFSAVNYILEVFLNRNYESDGEGGLFTIEDADKDLRDVEIWYQMCWYLKDYL